MEHLGSLTDTVANSRTADIDQGKNEKNKKMGTQPRPRGGCDFSHRARIPSESAWKPSRSSNAREEGDRAHEAEADSRRSERPECRE